MRFKGRCLERAESVPSKASQCLLRGVSKCAPFVSPDGQRTELCVEQRKRNKALMRIVDQMLRQMEGKLSDFYRLGSLGLVFVGVSLYMTSSTYALVPQPPSGAIAIGVTDRVAIAWNDNSSNETGFGIERKIGSSGNWIHLANVGQGQVSYTDFAITPGTTYYYRVYAFNTSGLSAYSNETSTTVPGGVPSAPSGAIAIGVTDRVAIAWNDNSSNETGFGIERKIGSAGNWIHLANVGQGQVSYTDFAITPGTTYYYRVYAFNTSGLSAYSNETSTTVPGGVPSAPSGAIAIGVTDRVAIAWNDNSSNETGFGIERKIGSSGNWIHLANVGQGQVSYT